MSTLGYKKLHYPKSRVATFDVGKIGNNKHHIAGFVEIDVTGARKKIKDLRKEKRISFYSWFIKTVSDVVSSQPLSHGLMDNRKRIFVFEDIDIAMPIERNVNGEKVPLALLIKKVNEKSISEIYSEIEKAKNQVISDEGDFVLGEKKSRFMMNLFYSLPQKIRMFFWKKILYNPFKAKESMGTVIITSVSGQINFSGWILPKSMHNLCLGLGSISKKPWVVNNKIEIREILHLTILFDHDVIDGAPAARFINKLVKYLEKSYGIENSSII